LKSKINEARDLGETQLTQPGIRRLKRSGRETRRSTAGAAREKKILDRKKNLFSFARPVHPVEKEKERRRKGSRKKP